MQENAIVCVDDEIIVLNSLREQLENGLGSNFIIEIAEDPFEAMELIKELKSEGKRVLVVISDWLMPKQKGDEFLTNVHLEYPEVITVLLSGQADDDAVDRARKNAALHAYVKKPWLVDKLIESIHKGLQERYVNRL